MRSVIENVYFFFILVIVGACIVSYVHQLISNKEDEFFAEVERCRRDFDQPSQTG